MEYLIEWVPVKGPGPEPDYIEAPAIMRCYFCAQEAGAHWTDDEAAEAFPRNVVNERVISSQFDPTVAYTLSCGHTII